ncbi:MAG: GNAT family N-acyltransferase [Flammeovirgaceae bacterium]
MRVCRNRIDFMGKGSTVEQKERPLDLRELLKKVSPELGEKLNSDLLLKLLKELLYIDKLNEIIETNQHLRGFSFLDRVLEHFEFTYQATARSYQRIPDQGRLIVIANHPLGALDGLALLRLIRSVRPDVRIIANYMLAQVENLKPLFLAVDNFSDKASMTQYKAMLEALNREEALVIFPAGEVSRIQPTGIQDGKWKTGFLKLAKKTKTPILPVYIDANNSALFYLLSALYKPIGTTLLVHEMFKQQNKEISIKVGKPVSWDEYGTAATDDDELAKLFKKHLMNLGIKRKRKKEKARKKPIFKGYNPVAHSIDRKELKKELYTAKLLGATKDGKRIFLYDYKDDSPVINELARLRELTFRSVEEGTGTPMDFDVYDTYYHHIVLWDDNDLEIVGSYRIGNCADIIQAKGIAGLYTSDFYDFSKEFEAQLPHSIELGRSFIQPRYWGRQGLDYLWYGIGSYIYNHPEIKYMFGLVSLSNAYSDQAKNLIIGFYEKQFGGGQQLATAKKPFKLKKDAQAFANEEFSGSYKSSFKKLKVELNKLGVTVPSLYKYYPELCDDKGCQFIGFSLDPDFNNCIDSFIQVDVSKITEKKRKRYIDSHKDKLEQKG